MAGRREPVRRESEFRTLYNRAMRRRDREIAERTEIDALLSQARVCRLAFAVAGEPYIVPLSHGYDRETGALLFHTAREGRKIDCIEANPRVCFEVEGRVEVKAGDERGCSWGMRYESVIGWGTIREILDAEAGKEALRRIMTQQSGRDGDWTFSASRVAATRVWCLDIESVTGKRSLGPGSV
jgi:nitroimidazol reductase NimA-like FMN-containing flavoprotein (pyridoxamine 5'-phosphate oxidase superfamily)